MTLRQELDAETIIESRSKGGYLRLDAEGFSASSRRREKRRSWDEVTGFRPADVKGGTPDTMGSDTLPGVYPNAEEVVELMERWRQRHTTFPQSE